MIGAFSWRRILEDDPVSSERTGCKALQRQTHRCRARRGACSGAIGVRSRLSSLARPNPSPWRRPHGRRCNRERDGARREAASLRAELDELRAAQARLEQTIARRDDTPTAARPSSRARRKGTRARQRAREPRATTADSRGRRIGPSSRGRRDALDRELGERLSRSRSRPLRPADRGAVPCACRVGSSTIRWPAPSRWCRARCLCGCSRRRLQRDAASAGIVASISGPSRGTDQRPHRAHRRSSSARDLPGGDHASRSRRLRAAAWLCDFAARCPRPTTSCSRWSTELPADQVVIVASTIVASVTPPCRWCNVISCRSAPRTLR